MPTTDLHINSDIVNIVNGLNQAVDATDRLGNETKDYQQKSNQAFTSTENSLKDVNQAIKDQEKILKELNRESEKYAKRANKLSADEQKAWKRLQGDIKVAGKEMDALKGKQAQLGESANNVTSNLSAGFTKLAGLAAAAFTGAAIVNYTKEAVILAGQAEGVEQAFERLNDPKLLSKLTEATRGTVSELDLMKNAVKANNFKIPLEQLATFFEFATKRAAQTGESVDYLVESIILGVGRKSPLILDNLGISAIALREKFSGVSVEAASVGDVSKAMGELIDEEMTKMGDVVLTTGQKIEQMKATSEDLKTEWGKLVIQLGDIGVFEGLVQSLKGVSTGLDSIMKLGFGNFWAGIQHQIWGGSDALNGLNDQLDQYNNGIKAGAAEIKRRDDLSEKGLNELKAQLIAAADENIKFNESTLGNEATIAYWKAYKEAVEKYVPAIVKADDANKVMEESLDSLKAKLKELQDAQSAAPLSQFASFQPEIDAIEKQIALYEKKKDKAKDTDKNLKTLAELERERQSLRLEQEIQADIDSQAAQEKRDEEYRKSKEDRIDWEIEQDAALYDEELRLQKEFNDKLEKARLELEAFTAEHPIAAALGFTNQEQLDQVKDYVGQLAEFANELIDQQVQATQRVVDDQNTRIEEQQNLVNQEFQLKEEGLANNYRVEQENLKKMQIARDAAIKDREKAIRIQRTLSTIEAGVSLVTAAANIMKGFSGIPIVGVALGLAAVGVLIAGFIAAQGRVKEAAQLKTGGRLNGPAHSEGGMRIEGTDYEVEGKEWFVNARSSEKYNDLLTAINKDDPKGLQIAVNRHNLIKAFPVNTGVNIDDSKKLGEIVKLMKSGDGMFMGNGFYIEKRGTMRKTIRLN